MKSWLSSPSRWVDRGVSLLLATGYTLWLLATVSDLGYARDEGFYFDAADAYGRWFEVLFSDPGRAFEKAVVDRHWRVNHEHPALIKSLFAASHGLFYERLGWFAEPGTSYRFVGMLMSAMAVAVTYLWGSRVYAALGVGTARLCALVAACSFALMPRIFYHAHLDCFDMPVLAMWMVTSYAYWRSLHEPGLRWPFIAAILYGLLLNTKHNSWLLPFALVGHWVLWRGPGAWRLLRQKQWAALLRSIPVALWLMASLGPLLFYATWPWIWFDTFDRLVEYVKFHTQHVYYNMEFLGQTYFEPPFPRLYAPLMTLGTVPAVTLALFGAGLALFARQLWQHVRNRPAPAVTDVSGSSERLAQGPLATMGLWLLFILISYSPWLSNRSPIFGGTKHWITAYPFMALFAGLAFGSALRAAHLACRAPGRWAKCLEWGLAASALIAPFVITQHSHPWGLTAYTPIVGGAPGAASLGLNRSFWGYTTGAVVEEINELSPRGTKVFIHDTATSSWRMLVEDGRLRADLRPQLGVAFSRLAIYHHEQHMSRVEHQIWVDYGTVSPAHIGSYDGVPVVWLYRRPE